jgi:hypothetical protein
MPLSAHIPIDMAGIQVSYLVEHPEYVLQLPQWLFEQWDAILGKQTLGARIKKLNAHMNRDTLIKCSELPPFGCMIWRGAKTCLRGSAEYLLARSFGDVALGKRSGHGRERCPVARRTDSLFVHPRQAKVLFTPGLECTWPVCLARATR